jgi:membrane dipeptidase
VGADHVGIGSDLDFAGLSNPIPRPGTPSNISGQPNFSRYNAYMAEDGNAHVDGMNHPLRLFDLTEELIKRRHSDATIRLILGGAFIRALSETWKPA